MTTPLKQLREACAKAADDLLNTNADGTVRDGIRQARVESMAGKAIRAIDLTQFERGDKQEAQIKALREDAERYHWLRDNGGYFALPTNQLKHKDGKWLWEELLDAARKK